jgi:hypothetical protein
MSVDAYDGLGRFLVRSAALQVYLVAKVMQFRRLEMTMRLAALSIMGLTILALASGCDHAKSPQTAANDIAAAKESAAQEEEKARRDAAKDINGAQQQMQEKSGDLAQSNAKASYEIAIAKADGDRKVAIQQCMTLDRQAQKACKETADADYDAAKANAKASRAAQQQ